MAKKPDVMDGDEIATRVLQKSAHSVSWADSKLSKERERVTNYLNGVWPRRQSEGSSSYISSDVYDSVQMQKAQLLEVFAGGDNIVQFDPDQDMNAEDCRVATEYARYIIFRQNNGYNVFDHVIYDALTSRAGVAKVYWEEKYEYAEETFGPLPEADVHALAAQEDVDEFEAEEDPATGLYSGELVRKYDRSQVCIVVMAPEEFLIESMASSIFTSDFVAHRTPKTKAELIDMGYDKKLVMELPYDDAKDLSFSPEVMARRAATDADQNTDEPIQDELQHLVLYECFVRMEIDKKKGVRLYKVCIAGKKLLSEPEEVDKAPFISYVPLPVPHVFYGDNFAARVIPTQNARTVLFRGVLDHTAITSNPRYKVVNGGLMNPRELLDNRLGGVVNVRRPDSVEPFQQQNLNPFVLNVLGMLTENNDKSTGISALSQGLNKDAISTQNSQGLVDNMMKASGQRGKIMARNFAYNFLVPLYIEVIRLAILHEKKPKIIEVAGAPLNIDVTRWTERTSCSVSQHLGYGEKDMMAMELVNAYQMLAKDPSLQNAFGIPQKFELLHDVSKLKGMVNFAKYLDKNAQPPGPDPLKTRELDIKEKSANAALAQAQAAQQKDNRLAAMDQSKLALEQTRTQIDAVDKDRTNDRQDAETSAKIMVAEKELEIAEKAAVAKATATVNPNV